MLQLSIWFGPNAKHKKVKEQDPVKIKKHTDYNSTTILK